MKSSKHEVSNWSNYPKIDTREEFVRLDREILDNFESQPQLIARGAGRCYGDASLSENIINTTQYHHILAFDEVNGLLTCEAGATLEKILDLIVPKGWFLPVTPGTKFITVGGAVASNVHGKNHHKEGCFCDYVTSLDLLTSDGLVKKIGPNEEPELFDFTCGGMGLSGVILRVSFQLKKIESAYISQYSKSAANLDEIFELFESHKSDTYTMAWIDCFQSGKNIGRSIFYSGEHAALDQVPAKLKKNALTLPHKKKISIPFFLPSITLNPLTLKAFNLLYYYKNKWTQGISLADYDSFFYPLDSILHWNRGYGKKGFVQYQFVIPLAQSKEGLRQILNRINEKGMGSFLAVLKLFGPQEGTMAFPMEGYTLALDFPVKKGLWEFLDELDALVLKFGGRIYLTKDARMSPEMFNESYTSRKQIAQLMEKYNPKSKFQSILSQRLVLTKKTTEI